MHQLNLISQGKFFLEIERFLGINMENNLKFSKKLTTQKIKLTENLFFIYPYWIYYCKNIGIDEKTKL